MTKRSKKDPTKLVDALFEGPKAQTVTVPGTAAAEVVIPQLAANIKALLEQRATIAEQVEELLAEFPQHVSLAVHAGSWHQDRRQHTPGRR